MALMPEAGSSPSPGNYTHGDLRESNLNPAIRVANAGLIVDKVMKTIETKTLINHGGGNPTMTISSIFALLSQTG